jgi:hypothetical protein
VNFRQAIQHPWWPFVAPFALFMLFIPLNQACSILLHSDSIYAIYPIQAFATGVLVAFVWGRLPAFRLTRPLMSVIVGLVAFGIWIAPEFLSLPLGKREGGFNPTLFQSSDYYIGLVGFRLLGAVVVVPIVEELFWRGFLMRYIISSDFQSVPIGRYTHLSFWITTVFFVSIHRPADMPAAVVVGVLLGAWFAFTKSLGNVMMAHAATNLALGIYVLVAEKWYYW